MGPDGGAVDRDLLPEPWQELPELIGQRRETVGYQIVMGPEPVDKPIEGAAVWERAAEAAQQPERRVVLKTAYERVRVGQVQDEAAEVGTPEGREAVAFGSARSAVLLKAGDNSGGVDAVKDFRELGASRRLRNGIRWGTLRRSHRRRLLLLT